MADWTTVLFCPIGDGNHRAALKQLSAFAERAGGEISVLAAVEDAGSWDRTFHPDHVETVQLQARTDWTKTLAKWSEIDHVTSTDIRIGPVAEVILERAMALDADAIAISAADVERDRGLIRKVMRAAQVPVWLVHPTRAKKRRILAAIDPEPAEIELNTRIVRTAASLAEAFDGSLHLLAAWQLYGEHSLRHSAFVRTSTRHFHDLMGGREEMTRRGVAEIADAAGIDIPYEIVVAHGPPVATITDTVRRLRSNMVVLGTVGRAGLGALVLGNTAEQLADVLPCSVVTVAPPST